MIKCHCKELPSDANDGEQLIWDDDAYGGKGGWVAAPAPTASLPFDPPFGSTDIPMWNTATDALTSSAIRSDVSHITNYEAGGVGLVVEPHKKPNGEACRLIVTGDVTLPQTGTGAHAHTHASGGSDALDGFVQGVAPSRTRYADPGTHRLPSGFYEYLGSVQLADGTTPYKWWHLVNCLHGNMAHSILALQILSEYGGNDIYFRSMYNDTERPFMRLAPIRHEWTQIPSTPSVGTFLLKRVDDIAFLECSGVNTYDNVVANIPSWAWPMDGWETGGYVAGNSTGEWVIQRAGSTCWVTANPSKRNLCFFISWRCA